MKKSPVITVLRHLFFWCLAYIALFLTVLKIAGFDSAVEIATTILLPGIFPVYLNFLSMKFLLEKRHYLWYFLSLIPVLAISTIIAESFFQFIVNDPDSSTAGLGTSLFFIAITAGLTYYRRGVQQQIKLQEIEKKQLKTELDLLRSQQDPHFFFNTLNNLYSLSLDNSDKVPQVILDLSDLMRYVLACSGRKTVSLSERKLILSEIISVWKN